MTEKQKYAIKLAINTMNKHFGRHYNTVYGNRETGASVGYGEAINILSDMLSNADNHTCNCKHNNNSRDSEPCCRCDSRQTNADRIRNMSDEELAEFLSVYDLGLKGNDLPTLTDWLDWLQSEVKVEESEEK